MKIYIFTVLLVPYFAFAKVTVHQDEFKLTQTAKGSHFWARLYDWKAWAKTEKQRSLKLRTNFIKEAYDNGDSEYDTEGVDEDDMIALLGPVEGAALYEFYEEREESYEDSPIDPEDIGGPSGLVTAIKVAVDLPDSFDVQNLDLDLMYKIIAQADRPHMHTEVSKDFVHNFVDSLHSAHSEVENLRNGKIALSIVNTGPDYYNCSLLNTALKFEGGLRGITTYDESFRTYLLNTVEELNLRSNFSGKSLIEGKPLRLFKQKVIYSSNLIKSGVNFLAFYENSEGRKQLVLNSVVVVTGQVKKMPENFVNGVSLIGEVFSGIQFENDLALLNSKNVDLSPLKGSCSKGLGQGMGRYVLGLAHSIVRSPLLNQ